MKTKTNIFKTAFIALALICSAQTFAQVYPAPSDLIIPVTSPADLGVGTITSDEITTFTSETTNTVGFYKPDNAGAPLTGFTLKASLIDANTIPISFDTYIWYELSNVGGTETPNVLPETSSQLTVSNLPAGYHKYRVYGQVEEGSVFCPSDEYQDMIVFVLPRLNVAPALAGSTLIYCENDVPPTGTNTLSATIEADYTSNTQSYPKPGDLDAAAAFTLVYAWYALPSGGGTAVSLGTTPTVDISATTLAPGTYTFYVDVEYDTAIRSNVVEERDYVIYGGASTVTTGTIIVTATPGTPTISVDSVTD